MIATTIPYRAIDNRVIISCRVDGHGPYSFILDTGASFSLTPRVARELGLRTKAAGRLSGAGNATQTFSTTRVPSLAIGGFIFANVRAVVIDLSEVKNNIGFPQLDGTIGSETLVQFRTKIDPDAKRVTLSRVPLPVPPNATRIPFKIQDGIIAVRGTIDGIAGPILIDTGDRSSLTLFGPFARRYDFYHRYHAVRNAITGFGLGGPIYADVFRLRSLHVLGANLSGVVARASRQHAGVFATGSEAGSIGGGVLRRFDVVYDYPGGALEVWPSKAAPGPDPYDRAGMWLSRSGAAVVVRDVSPGGPAAAGGIVVGDTILALNGRYLRNALLPDVRTQLATLPSGTTVRLIVRSDGVTKDVPVTLRDRV
jgi:Aspartyl protease/PDZ domain